METKRPYLEFPDSLGAISPSPTSSLRFADLRRRAHFLTPSGRTQSTVHRNALPCAMPAPPNPHPSSVPYLLLQPLVENAIRHGIAPRKTGGRVEIHIDRRHDDLHLRLRNDGVAAPPEGVDRASRTYVDDLHAALATMCGSGD